MDLFIRKLKSKLKNFTMKHFGQTRKSIEISKIFLALVVSLYYSYYISDYYLSYLPVFLLLSLIFYIAFTVLYFPLKFVVISIKKMEVYNIISIVVVFFAAEKIISDIPFIEKISDFSYYFITCLITLIIFVFGKAVLIFFNKKNISSFLFLFTSTIPVLVLVFFCIFKGFDEKEVLVTRFNEDRIKSEALYEVEEKFYEGEKINLSRYVSVSSKKKKIREKLFGHTLSNAPVRGVIYKPKNNLKKDVLFIVHGNHRATAKSHLGYKYLGEFLASRGICVVSIDMNYLNGFMKYGLSNENDARAMTLYENIKYIFNMKDNEDLNREVFLAGHSRGAEAVTILKAFSDLKRLPENGNSSLDIDLKIKGIISISGTYGQYMPSSKYLFLKNVNFLALHGTNDSDVTGFDQYLQYENLENDKDHFSSCVYIPYANHGNFNEIWGDYDLDFPDGLFFNIRGLLDGDIQREIVEVLSYNFIKASNGDEESKRFFYDFSSSKIYIPKLHYYQSFRDGSFSVISNFDEDYDIETATDPRFSVSFNGFSTIYEDAIKVGNTETTNGIYLKSKTNANLSFFSKEFVEGKNYISFDISKFEPEGEIKVDIIDYFGRKYTYNISEEKELFGKTKVERSKIEHFVDEKDYFSAPSTVKLDLNLAKRAGVDIKKIRYIDFNFSKNNDVILDNLGFCD